MSDKWPAPIPGQRLGIDSEGRGYIAEPLYSPENAPTREKILKAGMKLAPETETFEGIDVASWLHWLMKAVASGVARIVKGEFPRELPGKPRLNFIMAEPEPSANDRLTAAIERQNALMAQLLERLAKR
jgi:hypothetical protein